MKVLRRRKGLSVIEIVLSLIIITISVTVVFNMFLLSENINDRTRQLDAAVFFATKVLGKEVPESDEELVAGAESEWIYENQEKELRAFLVKSGDGRYQMKFYNFAGDLIYEVQTAK